MLKIAICDDEKYFRESIREYIKRYLNRNCVDYEIDIFDSGKELIKCGTDIVQYSVIFLDINMSDIDGIVTAQKIREYSLDIYIVFVTAYIKYSLEGYKVNAERYILKNNVNLDGAIDECMDAIISKMNRSVLKRNFKFSEGEKSLSIEQILYIESKLHKLEFYVAGEELERYTLWGTLNEIEDEYRKFSFVRVHQSYMVNLKHIKYIGLTEITLDNDKEVPVSRTRYESVRKSFIAYKGEI